MRRTRSSDPSSARRAASACSAHRRAASAPAATSRAWPSLPVHMSSPSDSGTCPATKASEFDTTTGTYEASACGGGGSSSPSSRSLSPAPRGAEPTPAVPRPFSGESKGAFAVPDQQAPLQLVRTPPDAVGLMGPDGVLEAFDPDGACRTDRLGLVLPGVLLRLGLEVVGGEEQRGGLAAAGC